MHHTQEYFTNIAAASIIFGGIRGRHGGDPSPSAGFSMNFQFQREIKLAEAGFELVDWCEAPIMGNRAAITT